MKELISKQLAIEIMVETGELSSDLAKRWLSAVVYP